MYNQKKILKRVSPCPESDSSFLKSLGISLKNEESKENPKNHLKKKSLFDHLKMSKASVSEEFGKSFHMYMNRLIEYPRSESAKHLISLADLTSSRSSEPLSLLVTTFGFEKEFINYLLEFTKVHFAKDFNNNSGFFDFR